MSRLASPVSQYCKPGRRQRVPRSKARRLFLESLEDRLALANNITISTGGLDAIPFGATTLADTADYTIDPVAFNVAGSVTLQANNDILFQSSVNKSTSGGLLAEAGRSIAVAANLITAGGDLTLNANQGATPASGNFRGIEVNGARIGSTSGAVTLRGKGGTMNAQGVYLHSGAAIGHGTSGVVTVIGTGGAYSDNVHGVWLRGTGTRITSGGGNVVVTGQGGQWH